jgi:hypothetical protein
MTSECRFLAFRQEKNQGAGAEQSCKPALRERLIRLNLPQVSALLRDTV